MGGERSLSIPRAALGVGFAAVAAYANSLLNGFVWDDPIILSRQLPAFRSLRDVLVPPSGIPQFSPDYYRPVVIMSYLLDRILGGENPLIYHATVVLAHAVATILIFLLAVRLFGSRPGAGFGAVSTGTLFAVHPVHTESVGWIAGRSDVFATCFVLAALLVHGSRKHSLITGLCVLLALGAKETALAIFPLLVLQDWTTRRWSPEDTTGWPVLLRRYIAPVTAAVLYLGARRIALHGVLGVVPESSSTQRPVSDLAGAVAMYLGRLVAPVHLCAYIDTIALDGPILAGTAVFVAAAIGLVAVSRRERDTLPLFLLAWVVVSLLPSLAVVWRIPEVPVAERYLYLPSVGYSLLLGYLGARVRTRRGGRVLAWLALLVLALSFLVATVTRNLVWRDNLSLWSDTVSKTHVSGTPVRGLAAELQKRGRLEEAERYFEAAFRRRNTPLGRQVILNNLGTIAMQRRDYERAEKYYRQALDAAARMPDTLFNLGLAILERGQRSPQAAREAIVLYRQAAVLSPHDPDIEAALGQALSIAGEHEEAVSHMRRALEFGVRPETAASIRSYLERVGGR